MSELPPLSQPPELNHTGPIPLYLQIKSWLRQQIVSGDWPEHYKLKAEADLALELQVSRGTIRKALAELIAEGLLVQTHGRGTFVAARVLEQPLAERLVTFSEDLISRGIPFETQVLEQKVIPVPERVVGRLLLPAESPVFFLKRVRLVNGEPMILLHNYVVYERCPTIEKIDFIHSRLFEALEEHFGLTIDYGHRSFEAQVADKDIAKLLGIAKRDPVMYMEQSTYLQDGSPIECSELWLRGDRFKLGAMVKRNDPNSLAISLSTLEITPGLVQM
ncbi:MAG: GntR family transcriptional regulator [Anaerolineae bacterium]|nr:GntR family transcriptional regulator [Anaerolineae bacterium]